MVIISLVVLIAIAIFFSAQSQPADEGAVCPSVSARELVLCDVTLSTGEYGPYCKLAARFFNLHARSDSVHFAVGLVMGEVVVGHIPRELSCKS